MYFLRKKTEEGEKVYLDEVLCKAAGLVARLSSDLKYSMEEAGIYRDSHKELSKLIEKSKIHNNDFKKAIAAHKKTVGQLEEVCGLLQEAQGENRLLKSMIEKIKVN